MKLIVFIVGGVIAILASVIIYETIIKRREEKNNSLVIANQPDNKNTQGDENEKNTISSYTDENGAWWSYDPDKCLLGNNTFRGKGGYISMPYNGGYLVYPYNFPIQSNQVNTTNLHPFCIQREINK